MNFLLNFINILTQVLVLAIFVRAILSWFPIARTNPFVEVVFQITEPVLGPLRRVLPTIGFIDITPLVAIVLLQLINGVIAQLLV